MPTNSIEKENTMNALSRSLSISQATDRPETLVNATLLAGRVGRRGSGG